MPTKQTTLEKNLENTKVREGIAFFVLVLSIVFGCAMGISLWDSGNLEDDLKEKYADLGYRVGVSYFSGVVGTVAIVITLFMPARTIWHLRYYSWIPVVPFLAFLPFGHSDYFFLCYTYLVTFGLGWLLLGVSYQMISNYTKELPIFSWSLKELIKVASFLFVINFVSASFAVAEEMYFLGKTVHVP